MLLGTFKDLSMVFIPLATSMSLHNLTASMIPTNRTWDPAEFLVLKCKLISNQIVQHVSDYLLFMNDNESCIFMGLSLHVRPK